MYHPYELGGQSEDDKGDNMIGKPYDTIEKPPIGVMPREMWLELRFLDIARAINDYIKAGRYIPEIRKWIEEEGLILDEMERIRDNNGR